MSLNREQALFMEHVAELIRKAPELGLCVTGGELYRTTEQQQIYVRDGRSKTTDSQHLKRLAIDLNFFRKHPDGRLELIYSGDEITMLGAFWESLDPANRWGGNWNSFKDVPHFERRESLTAAVTAPKPSGTAAVTAAVASSVGVAAIPRGAKLLSGPVGARMQNAHDDVETVQRLLNLNRDRFALGPLLNPDGIFGQKTIDAIRQFQMDAQGTAEPSGVVRPGDSCLVALCMKIPADVNRDMLSLAYLNASDAALTALTDALVATMNSYQIDSPRRKAHFLAQIGHESGQLRFREEVASGSAYEGRRDLGNVHAGDGQKFKGRGLMQLTGRANYESYLDRARQLAQADVVGTPELVGSDDRLCTDVAGWFWNRKKLNQLADDDDLEGITRRINGGLNGLADRKHLYLRLKALFGIDA